LIKQMVEHHILDQTVCLHVGSTCSQNLLQFMELLTGHGRIEVNVDMDSLIAQASCAEQNGGNTDVCKVKVGPLKAGSCSSF